MPGVPNEHLTGHANPWRTAEHARDWIARMDREPRDRSDELRMVVSLLPFKREMPVQVLELGAGHGALTTQVLDELALSRVTALDLSPVMVEEGRRRLAGYGDRITYHQWDLEETGWPSGVDGPFDGIVSSLAIHHLNRERKATLARQLFERLRPGGVFLNLDYTAPASESLALRYEHAQASMADDGHDHSSGHSHAGHGHNLAGGHATDSLFVQLDELEAAGFEDVDVFWKRLGLAIFGGTRKG
jgi:SAM-dependent methyltransferase